MAAFAKKLSGMLLAMVCATAAQGLPACDTSGKACLADTLCIADTLCVADTLCIADTLCVADTTCRALSGGMPERSILRWRSAGDFMLVNGIFHLTGRYLLKEGFSKTTMNSIRQNLKSGFIWDDDKFFYNLFGHSFQGGLYFNTARCNGMSFAQSAPYALAGALFWEYFGEAEQQSVNDVITTAMAGTLYGEITYRMSKTIVNNRERGPKRFLREAVNAVVNPVDGFHRLVSGKAWRVRGTTAEGEEEAPQENTSCHLEAGVRCLASHSQSGKRLWQPFLSFAMEYGETTDGERHFHPYDAFSAEGTFAFGHRQHILSDLSLTGRICSTPASIGRTTRGEWGFYQFFRYYDARPPGLTAPTPFPFGETASFGPGLRLKFLDVAPRLCLEQSFFARGILLGTVNSDYYRHLDRSYNMGSGWGVSTDSRMTWRQRGAARLRVHYTHLFTWRGYETKDMTDIPLSDNHLNVLGDRSNAHLLIVNLQTEAHITRQATLSLGASCFIRRTHYEYHPDQRAQNYEMRAALAWHF